MFIAFIFPNEYVIINEIIHFDFAFHFSDVVKRQTLKWRLCVLVATLLPNIPAGGSMYLTLAYPAVGQRVILAWTQVLTTAGTTDVHTVRPRGGQTRLEGTHI